MILSLSVLEIIHIVLSTENSIENRKKGPGAYSRKYEELHQKNSGQIFRCAICVNSTSVRKAMILKAKYKILTVSFREGESATSHC